VLSTHPSVVLDDLTFTWPDGTPVLDHLTATFPAVRTGLTGANGTGKSTLLRILAGELSPTAGHLAIPGSVGYLPQRLTLDTDATVADLLGVRAVLDALARIEHGSTDPADFDAVGDDWDIGVRCLADLAAAGLHGIELSRRVGTLSGGQRPSTPRWSACDGPAMTSSCSMSRRTTSTGTPGSTCMTPSRLTRPGLRPSSSSPMTSSSSISWSTPPNCTPGH